MELLGDPLTLFSHVGTGVADFFIKTRSEMIGIIYIVRIIYYFYIVIY